MSLKNRIDRLEHEWGNSACPACGKSEDTVVVRTSWDSEPEAQDEPERCPMCWEPPIVVKLDWD
jgi:hypothetical protein